MDAYRSDEDEVMQLGRAVRRRAQLDAQAAALAREVLGLRSALSRLRVARDGERADVERLERRSLAWILWSAVGQGEARLEKERVEAMHAEVAFTAKQLELDAAAAEAERIDRERAALEGVREAYARAFDAKVRRVLEAAGGPTRDEVQAHVDAVHVAAQAVREIDEALEAGLHAERHLAAALDRIRALEEEEVATMTVFMASISSMGWGSTTATALEIHLQQAQVYVRRYIRELADVPVLVDPGWRANFLQAFVELVVGFGTDRARRAKTMIRQVLDEIRRTQLALGRLREEGLVRYREAHWRYTAAVERA